LNRVILGGVQRFVFESPNFSFLVKKHESAVIEGEGRIVLRSHLQGVEAASLTMGRNSRLIVHGNFAIGNGVRISLEDNAVLEIGGCLREPTSGITAQAIILVKKRISIGFDFICAWETFISDCDWHAIEGRESQADVRIGDHVWVAHGCSILKGSTIGEGSIVGCHSVVLKGVYQPHSLLAGNPALEVKHDLNWRYSL
jgi:acetyltransferase-like isoleucine patch superfamily enzyme